MITDKEIQGYWNRYDLFIILWNLVSFFGVILIFPIPISYLLKYKFGVKGLWLLNDTKDGDFGDPEELKKAGRKEGRTIGNFIWWWKRNHSWNFNRKFTPEWNGGDVKDFRIIMQILPTGSDKFTWCSKDGVHGINYIAYRVNGKVEVRYSRAGENHEKQLGSGGNEYRFKIKNIFYNLLN